MEVSVKISGDSITCVAFTQFNTIWEGGNPYDFFDALGYVLDELVDLSLLSGVGSELAEKDHYLVIRQLRHVANLLEQGLVEFYTEHKSPEELQAYYDWMNRPWR